MKKSEIVILELLSGAVTQKAIAEKLGISLSTVNNAIAPLARMGAIEKRNFGLRLIDREKALTYWASKRNLVKDTIYSTRTPLGVVEMEKLMPTGVVFTAYTAFKLKYREVPSDYGEVYVYADEGALAELKKRFPPKEGPANVIALKKEINFGGGIAPDEVVFVDLWNLKEWYAKEFIKALREKSGFA